MRTYGVKDLCQIFDVGEHVVLKWIGAGELRAVNVASQQGTRPKWRVSQEALDLFMTTRAASPPPPKTLRRKRDPEIIELIK